MVNILLAILLFGAPIKANAQAYGFDVLPSSFVVGKGNSTEEVTNLPPVMSQDSLGICYSYVASTLMTAENCRETGQDCRSISPSKIFSPLGLAPLGNVDEEKNGDAGAKKKFGVGGSSGYILHQAINGTSRAPSEQCLSLDRILSKLGGAGEYSEIQSKIWEKMQSQFKQYQNIDRSCAECIANFFSSANDDLDENFGLKKTNEELLRAFASESYTEFLNKLFQAKECRRAKGSVGFEPPPGLMEVMVYPESKKKGTYEGAIDSIKSVLKGGRALSLGGICVDKVPSAKKCSSTHAVVIAGYRKVCNPQNECRDSVKVVNSWGKSWQDKNDNGWVDARALLDRTFYEEASLTWYMKKQ